MSLQTADAFMGIFGFKRVMPPLESCATCSHSEEKKGVIDLWCKRHECEIPHATSCRGWKQK